MTDLTTPQTWAIATDDTQLTLGLVEGKLCLTDFRNPLAAWNWAQKADQNPAVVTFLASTGGPKPEPLTWVFREALTATGQVTFVFTCASPALELRSQWLAQPGRGPVRHVMTIRNQDNHPVAVDAQPSLDLTLHPPEPAIPGLCWWYVNDEGCLWGDSPDVAQAPGYYQEPVVAGATREILASSGYDFIPIAICDAGSSHGIYYAVEWSHCFLRFGGLPGSQIRLEAGNPPSKPILIASGEEFLVPPVLLGAYAGDFDDCGNSLRSYLFHHSMPDVLRTDPTYPKLEWNSFTATGKTHKTQTEPTAWDPVEVKYYPFIKEVAALGFEEVAVDVAWWEGPEPVADPIDWPQGMKAAGDATHQLGMRYVLYWSDNENTADPDACNVREQRIRRLFQEYGADTWRSDATRGAVICPDYLAVKGFYDLLDRLQCEIPNFQWENCGGGGPIKDYGALKRCTKIQSHDSISPAITHRRVFWDSSLVLHPIQLQGFVGWKARNRPGEPGGLVYDFRTCALGAFQWFFDSPVPTNGGIPWTDDERRAIAREVQTYKTRLRPLIRTAQLYHILPRPDDRNWDGIQYYDPTNGKGVAYIFKPQSDQDRQTIRLKGLEAQHTYILDFEDGSNPSITLTGQQLMSTGFAMALPGIFVSELVWIRRA